MAKKTSTSEKKVRQIRRKSRKQYSGEEKIRIVLDGLRSETKECALGLVGRVRYSVSLPSHPTSDSS